MTKVDNPMSLRLELQQERDDEPLTIDEVLQRSQPVLPIKQKTRQAFLEDVGQDIAEYAVMLAVILIIVVGTLKLVGSNANNVFSNVASSMQ
jgi:Flp pilus assembly pilin Flp